MTDKIPVRTDNEYRVLTINFQIPSLLVQPSTHHPLLALNLLILEFHLLILGHRMLMLVFSMLIMGHNMLHVLIMGRHMPMLVLNMLILGHHMLHLLTLWNNTLELPMLGHNLLILV